jgi:hypothetical protein
VKFVRRLGVVTLMVAVVVIIGLAWNRFAPSTLIGQLPGAGQNFNVRGAVTHKGSIVVARPGPGGHVRQVLVLPAGAPTPGNVPGNPIIIHLRPMDLGLTSMFQRVNWPILEHAVVIEALVIAAVVIIDRIRRRLRRAWRARKAT